MTTYAYNVIEFCSQRYGDQITYTGGVKDADGDRITESEWIKYINDAIRMIVLIRPDANVTTTTQQLTNGTKQTLPSAAIRLIDITRNMGTNGTTEGAPIREVDRENLDLLFSDWHSETEETAIENYCYDLRNPQVYYVTPPSDGTQYVEIMYSSLPTLVSAVGNTVPLEEVYIPVIQDWCLYLAFSMDSDSAPNWQIGQHYFKSFAAALGMELSAAVNLEPPTQD